MNQETDPDRLALKELQKRESSACGQWRIQLQCFVLSLLSVIVNLLRGTPKFDSIIGLKGCNALGWVILAIFIIVCGIVTFFNIKAIRKENLLKEKFGCFHESEKYLSNKNLPCILILAFLCAFVGQIFGNGGGFAYGPVVLSLGAIPMVVAATMLYMIMFSSGSSSFMFFFFGRLNFAYTAFIAIFSGLGVVFGLLVMKRLVKKYKRPSLVAFALALAIIISNFMSIFSSIRDLKQRIDNDIDIM